MVETKKDESALLLSLSILFHFYKFVATLLISRNYLVKTSSVPNKTEDILNVPLAF